MVYLIYRSLKLFLFKNSSFFYRYLDVRPIYNVFCFSSITAIPLSTFTVNRIFFPSYSLFPNNQLNFLNLNNRYCILFEIIILNFFQLLNNLFDYLIFQFLIFLSFVSFYQVEFIFSFKHRYSQRYQS